MHYDEQDRMATPQDAMREYARNVGHVEPQRAWILTDWDVWVKNPFYQGPPVPHPEDAYMMTEEEAAAFAATENPPRPKIEPKLCPPRPNNDEIPF